jgi:hypothetical protein
MAREQKEETVLWDDAAKVAAKEDRPSLRIPFPRLLPISGLFLPSLFLKAQSPVETNPIGLRHVIIAGKAVSLIGTATSASKGQTSTKELLERPFLRRDAAV